MKYSELTEEQKSTKKRQVLEWRRKVKEELVELHGGKCIDCGFIGPAFMYDFDHLGEKKFTISAGRNRQKMIDESLGCELVCPNCHRMRTHKRICPGCNGCVA